jgi:hypothetical protein
MAFNAWVRTVNSSTDWTIGYDHIGGFIPAVTIERIRFSWGFTGITPLTGSLMGVMQNIQVLGFCTTVGEGGGPPPNPRLDSSDVDPPSQRWLHWEARAPVVSNLDGHSELVTWRDSGPQDAMSSKGMVSGASVPEGELLSLWASWASAYDWPADGQVQLWYGASVLLNVAA